MSRAALTLLVSLVLVGCVGTGQAARETPPSASASAAPSAPETPNEGDRSEAPDEPSGDPHGELACVDAELTAIDDVIDAQLEAFVDDDYAGALELASRDFREAFDEESFRTVIEDGFPIVAEATGHVSSVCVRRGDQAQLLITVQGRSGDEADLVYMMILEGETWRINGAEPAGEPDDGVRV